MRFPNYGLTFLISVFSIFSPVVLAQERIVCDETCGTSPDAKSVSVGYAVVSPVGRSTVGPIRQAPRLTTLDGKTIAVVGESFMCRITHPEIKRLIERNYPGAKVLLLDEVGTAGPYSAPGIRRKKKDDFEQRLKELKVDAVISGNGGCGLCTPKEVGSCLVAEHIGTPSVIICAPGFSAQARYTAANNGVPVMRVAEYPGAFANYYANPGGAKDGGRHNLMQYTGYLRRSEGAAMTEAPEWYCTPEDYIETVPTMQHGMTQFLVTGDNSRNKIQTMPGGACATVKVELPHDWDRLMAERGYRSLSDFRIQSSGKD